jgi:hypothetical protein
MMTRELIQQARDDELVGHRQVQALLLRAVPQGRVMDLKAVIEHRTLPEVSPPGQA